MKCLNEKIDFIYIIHEYCGFFCRFNIIHAFGNIYNINLKQASQNSILYSSEFKNTTGLTLINKIITSG